MSKAKTQAQQIDDTASDLMNLSEEEVKQLKHIGNKKPIIFVGMASCGIAAGAKDSLETVQKLIGDGDIDAEIVQVGCIGSCFIEPIIDVKLPGKTRVAFKQMEKRYIEAIITDFIKNNKINKEHVLGQYPSEEEEMFDDVPLISEVSFFKDQKKIVTDKFGVIDPENIKEYIAYEKGYHALAKILQSYEPEDVIEEIKKSGLRGRGGAGFPTYLKWALLKKEDSKEKYLICNADEGDPGAFMDRSSVEGNPHALLEGMIIAAYAIQDIKKGYIYIRAEYPLAIKRLKIAIKQAEEAGFLGDNILGSGLNFSIKIQEGAGAFVCGEETALMASIMGERGNPRPKPPFPAQEGLWNKPSNINNVKTYSAVPKIMYHGADWFTQYGTEKSPGTAILALTGQVKNTGLVEIPMGTPLHKLVYDVGGGPIEGKKIKAVQVGGPSGGCIPAKFFDTPTDYESITALGAIMGSGGIIVLDEDSCMVEVARFFLDFTQNESCGKCTPCRVGTRKLLQILNRLTQGKGTEEDLEKLKITSQTIKKMSLCGLGQTAPNPVLTTMKYFGNEYEDHIKGKCPAYVCKDLITYHINEQACTGCTLCSRACPTNAIYGERKAPHSIDIEKCIRCGLCYSSCNFDAIYKETGVLSDD